MSFLQAEVRNQRESWIRDHHQAMGCFDVEDRVSRHLNLAELIEKHRSKGAWDSLETVEEYWDVMDQMYEMTLNLMDSVAQQESNGFKVDGADKLRKYMDMLDVGMPQLRASRESLKPVIAGHGRSLDEVLNENRRTGI